MYLRECKQCQFLFRSTVKTKLCEDCKTSNHTKLLERRRNTPKKIGYAYQRRLKELVIEREDWLKK